MTNYRKILEYHAKGFSIRSIARSLNCNRRTVQDCIDRAIQAGISSPPAEELTNEILQELLYHKAGRRAEGYEVPDFAEITLQLKKKNMTLMLLWYRYASACKDSGLKYYQQTQFYELYRRHQQETSISVRIDREPGECVEIDWAGDALYIHEPVSELKIKASLFVATLSFSDYFYAEAFLNQKVRSWIYGHVNALQFFGGVPAILTPDNTRTAVIKSDKYEPDIHEAYQELADHYGTMIIPARVRKPKDKPHVEGTVGFLTRRIIADLQDEKFFTLGDLNQAIWERMDLLNAAPFTKKPGSREELFLTIEQKNLSPLPSVQFAYYERKQATVAPDFHVQFDRSFYSVPCKYIRHNVMIKATSNTVSVFTKDGTCIASHPRSIHPGQKLTHPDHLPVNVKEYSSWNRETFLSRAASIGPMTQEMVTRILASREFEVQAYRSCVGVLNLAGKYGKPILEQACGQALEIGIYSRKGIKTIINAIDLAMQEDAAQMQEYQGAPDEALDQFYCCHDENHPKLFHQYSPEEDAHDHR